MPEVQSTRRSDEKRKKSLWNTTKVCRHCKKSYTPEPKRHAYSEETREQAIKTYYAGISGRGVGKIFGMSKANVYNWIKKTTKNLETNYQFL